MFCGFKYLKFEFNPREHKFAYLPRFFILCLFCLCGFLTLPLFWISGHLLIRWICFLLVLILLSPFPKLCLHQALFAKGAAFSVCANLLLGQLIGPSRFLASVSIGPIFKCLWLEPEPLRRWIIKIGCFALCRNL